MAENTIYANKQDFAAGWFDASDAELGYVSATVGAEAAVAANAIEVACVVRDSAGTAASAAKVVRVEAFAVTDDKGDIAAAGTPVGTLTKVVNPAAGPNLAYFTTSAAGLFSFRVTDDAAETVLVTIIAEGCRPSVFKLTFA